MDERETYWDGVASAREAVIRGDQDKAFDEDFTATDYILDRAELVTDDEDRIRRVIRWTENLYAMDGRELECSPGCGDALREIASWAFYADVLQGLPYFLMDRHELWTVAGRSEG